MKRIANNRNGSALVIVILLMTAVMTCITSTWYSTLYATDIARKRQTYEQRLRATEGLINYAVALCKDNWQELVDAGPVDAELWTAQWPCGDGQQYAGTVSVKFNGAACAAIHAQLVRQGTPVCAISCFVRGVEDEQGVTALTIDGWQIEAL